MEKLKYNSVLELATCLTYKYIIYSHLTSYTYETSLINIREKERMFQMLS